MTGTEELVRTLAERVTALEDKLAILELMTSYGPAIDSGSADAVARLWTEDGVYDVDTGVMRGHAAITAMVQSQAHQGWIGGLAARLGVRGRGPIRGLTRATAVGRSAEGSTGARRRSGRC